jgi:Tol biopolymer transport system component
VVIEGKESAPVDLNVWGVTFTPGPRPETFYATVATGGHTWLAKGRISDSRLETVRGNVECPSVAPDGTRVAFKKREQVDGRLGWHLAVLDLDSGEETVLAERRSVDDQPEWLDDQTILYGLQREGSAEADVWAVPADGSGEPGVFVPRAWSPAVVR